MRAEIDTEELLPRSIEFMKRQAAAGKPFFLYLPFSMGHAPNLPSKQFAGKSAVGQYGDKMMEGDYHVGQVLDTLKDSSSTTTPSSFSRPTTVPRATTS